MSEFTHDFEWRGPSADPNDEQFGHVVEATTLDEMSDGDADRVDTVLVGEPTDIAVIGRKGAVDGPRALREALAGTKTHHFADGPVENVADLGNIAELTRIHERTQNVTVGGLQNRVREVTERVHALDALPVFLGGDNSLTYPNVAPLLSEGRVGVVNLDAHLDVREVGDNATSGTPYRQLFEAGLDGYACLGARHFETSTEYAEYVGETGGEIITSGEVGSNPLAAADRALDELRDVDHVYVSVDLDVLDVSAAPGVSAPTPGGLTTRELFILLRRLASDNRIAGFEVVECAPPLDRDGMTATAGARAVAHFLSGYAENGGHHA